MLTIESLTSELGLKVSAAEEAAGEREIRWMHISELLDPTPWLSGGELLLTTGMALTGPDQIRAYLERLVRHQLAGLGFGTGFGHASVPPALVQAAEQHGFPLFEVPYEVPF